MQGPACSERGLHSAHWSRVVAFESDGNFLLARSRSAGRQRPV